MRRVCFLAVAEERIDASREGFHAPCARGWCGWGLPGYPSTRSREGRGLAPSTVRETLKRFAASGLTWPLAEDMSDPDLEARLYKAAGTKQGHRRQEEPDWAAVPRELKRKHVTLSILWDEYIEQHPDGYRYSRYCDLLPHLGRKAVGHDAPGPCWRREAVRRLCRGQSIGGDRPADRRDPRGPGSSWPCSAPRTSPMPRRPGRKGWQIGSAPTPGPSRRSAG